MKKFLCTLLAAAMVLSLAACSSGTTGSPSNPASGASAGNGSADQKPVTLSFATAGDTNMSEFFNDEIAPAFHEKYPNITVKVTAAGVGDDGSRNIYTKWKAQKDAGKTGWDIDAACVHQSAMGNLISEGLVDKYVPDISNAKYVTTESSKFSLGTNVEGYVVPLFLSQIVLGYNSKTVQTPPKSYDELESWIKAHPKKFGYNGVTGGMSGVGFVAGWLYNKTKDYDTLAKGPYSADKTAGWGKVIKDLKSLPVTYTQGNAGTLDLLNRGEIDIGPVWVDMLLLWKSDGRMSKDVKMILPEPGMPGQPMYLVVGSGSAQKDAAEKFCDFLADPAVQAKYVVGKYTWYPGIDSNAVFQACTQETKDLLFKEVTADELSKKALSLPITEYSQAMQKIYAESK
ncbi:MAG TPA: ABC transporter substrate-binding protein [Ruminococcaceae bacterium]|nr:ABC transporter substrate-binding protein [Oscillospiraceae bacterium]